MADSVKDLLVRLTMHTEGDALDFQRTGRAVFVVEDEYGELPLPKGDPGEQGPPGPPGKRLTPEVVLDEVTDGAALSLLQERSRGWRAAGRNEDGYFALNEPTGTGFFYTRGGWVLYRDVFGANSEVVAGEFQLPVTIDEMEEPEAPARGVTLFVSGGNLRMKKPNGTVVDLG